MVAAYCGRRDIRRAPAGFGIGIGPPRATGLLSDWASAARAEARSGFGVRGRDLHEGNAFHGTWQLKAGLCGTANRQIRRGVLVVLEGEAASSADQGSSRLGPWVGSSSTDTGVLDYHRQFCRPAHEKMRVDEPWDALKGEVGPVLASSAPSPGQRGVRPDVWHVAPRSFLPLLLRRGR